MNEFILTHQINRLIFTLNGVSCDFNFRSLQFYALKVKWKKVKGSILNLCFLFFR